jgi:hypothetical protein
VQLRGETIKSYLGERINTENDSPRCHLKVEDKSTNHMLDETGELRVVKCFRKKLSCYFDEVLHALTVALPAADKPLMDHQFMCTYTSQFNIIKIVAIFTML